MDWAPLLILTYLIQGSLIRVSALSCYSWKSHIHQYTLGPGLLCSKFCLLCFWAVLKKLPIMLNIMPITTAIMPQFIYSFIIFNDYISIVRLQAVVFCIMHSCLVTLLNIMFTRKLVPHLHQVGMITVSQMKTVK